MSILIEQGATLAELDEALAHVGAGLKRDEFGDRMSWHKRDVLLDSMDGLLDERLEIMRLIQSGEVLVS